MEQGKNKNGLIILLAVLVVILIVLCVLFATGTISFKKDVSDNKQNNGNEQANNNIQSKRESITCMDTETTFNGITVKVKPEHDGGCHANSIVVNDKNVEVGGDIRSYEIFDNNIILYLAYPNYKLAIYSLASNSFVTELDSNDFNGYKLESYTTNNNIITIIGTKCDEECGASSNEDLITKYEIEYSNNTFSVPKLINKYTTQDLIDSVKITNFTFDAPRGGKFGGAEKSYTLAIDIAANLNCTNNSVIGVNINGYCLDKNDNKYIFEGPTGVGTFSCANTENKYFIQANQVLKADGKTFKIPDETNDINWDDIEIKYCKFDSAYLRLINMGKVNTKIELDYEKEFK